MGERNTRRYRGHHHVNHMDWALSSYAWQRQRMNNINRNIIFPKRAVCEPYGIEYVHAYNFWYWFSLLLHCTSTRHSHLFNLAKKKMKWETIWQVKKKDEKHGDCDLRWIIWTASTMRTNLFIFISFLFSIGFAFILRWHWCGDVGVREVLSRIT